jgi:iron complex transport system substrate-binding protein
MAACSVAARMFIIAVAGWWASTAASQQTTHTVTGYVGAAVVIPTEIDRIAEQFPAHTVTDIMLGAGDKLAAISQNVKTIPLLKRGYPRISSVPELFRSGGIVNMEDLLARRPDVVSATGRVAALKLFQTANIPAVSMLFNTFDEFRQSIILAGDVYGGSSKALAASYLEYFDTK